MSVAPTLLLVEDEPLIRMLLTELFTDEGYIVIEAMDGQVAIQVLREHRPPPEALQLVILDMMMPLADGLDVLQEVADLGSYVPVVAMSADRECLHQASAAGAVETFSKPFDLERLLTVVKRNCSD
jgi:two-component system response regulator ResD